MTACSYSAGLAWPSPRAAPTWSAVDCSAPAVNSSPPVWRMLYSCSMAVSCWSSAKDRAKGTPKNRADVVMTQAPLPLKERTLQALLPMELTLLEIQPRVVGGTMSRRAYRRSANVSFSASKSDSLEISESAWQCVSILTFIWRALIYRHGLQGGKAVVVATYRYQSSHRRPRTEQQAGSGSARPRPR